MLVCCSQRFGNCSGDDILHSSALADSLPLAKWTLPKNLGRYWTLIIHLFNNNNNNNAFVERHNAVAPETLKSYISIYTIEVKTTRIQKFKFVCPSPNTTH